MTELDMETEMEQTEAGEPGKPVIYGGGSVEMKKMSNITLDSSGSWVIWVILLSSVKEARRTGAKNSC